MQRIIGNLVENAIKHAQASRILVGARLRAGDRVLLQVVDNGRGIPTSELPFIFEEWFRGRQATTEGTRGQGLGLWAVQRCVEAMQGVITADSVIGKGTMFTVEFPAHAKRRTPFALPPCVDDGIQSRVIAVLDDDEDVLRAIRTSLESLGPRVFTTTDDLCLLAAVANMRIAPNLFLLDFNLGGSTVERTLRMLNAKLGKDLKAIIVTGHTSDSRLDELRTMAPVIGKPLSQANLRTIVDIAAGTLQCKQAVFN